MQYDHVQCILQSATLTHGQKVLLLYVLAEQHKARPGTKTNGWCTGTARDISITIGAHQSSVAQWLKSVVDQGWLEGKVGKRSRIYRIKIRPEKLAKAIPKPKAALSAADPSN